MTQHDRMIQMLRAAGPEGVTNRQFNNVGIYRYSARIEELNKKKGYDIKPEHLGGSLWRWVLESEPRVSEPGTVGRRMGNANAVPASDTLFDSKPLGTTRSAITGDVMDDAA